MAIDFDRFDVLTFDCYGTLIDWEAGLLAGLRAILDPHGVTADDEALLDRYAEHESALESGPYLRYREVLARARRDGLRRARRRRRLPDELAAFGGSVVDWPAFPDSAAALARLKRRFALARHHELRRRPVRRLEPRASASTSTSSSRPSSARGYKPDPRNFEVAFERIDRPRERILHVAQSLFHDHVPAKALGMTTVWINRRHDRPGTGATPPADATPDLVTPDMATFAALAAR